MDAYSLSLYQLSSQKNVYKKKILVKIFHSMSCIAILQKIFIFNPISDRSVELLHQRMHPLVAEMHPCLPGDMEVILKLKWPLLPIGYLLHLFDREYPARETLQLHCLEAKRFKNKTVWNSLIVLNNSSECASAYTPAHIHTPAYMPAHFFCRCSYHFLSIRFLRGKGGILIAEGLVRLIAA